MGQFSQLERSLLTKLLQQPLGQNSCPSPQSMPRKRNSHRAPPSITQPLDTSSVSTYLCKMVTDIRIEGLNLSPMVKRIQKRQQKIAKSVYWTAVDDIDSNLYDYILDKVSRDSNPIDHDDDQAVDDWIKGFWAMCQDVFTVPTIKEFLQSRPGFFHQYLSKCQLQPIVEPRNLSQVYEEEPVNHEEYALPQIQYKTPLKTKPVVEVSNSHTNNHEVSPKPAEQNYESPSKLLNLQTPKQQKQSAQKTPHRHVTPLRGITHRQTSSFKLFQQREQ